MEDSNTIDLNTFETLKGLMQDRFNYLIETYIEKTAEQLNDLEKAINDNNAASIVDITHAIKGSSASVGAQSMFEHSKEYEMSAKDGNFDGANEWANTLKQNLAAYAEATKAHL